MSTPLREFEVRLRRRILVHPSNEIKMPPYSQADKDQSLHNWEASYDPDSGAFWRGRLYVHDGVQRFTLTKPTTGASMASAEGAAHFNFKQQVLLAVPAVIAEAGTHFSYTDPDADPVTVSAQEDDAYELRFWTIRGVDMVFRPEYIDAGGGSDKVGIPSDVPVLLFQEQSETGNDDDGDGGKQLKPGTLSDLSYISAVMRVLPLQHEHGRVIEVTAWYAMHRKKTYRVREYTYTDLSGTEVTVYRPTTEDAVDIGYVYAFDITNESVLRFSQDNQPFDRVWGAVDVLFSTLGPLASGDLAQSPRDTEGKLLAAALSTGADFGYTVADGTKTVPTTEPATVRYDTDARLPTFVPDTRRTTLDDPDVTYVSEFPFQEIPAVIPQGTSNPPGTRIADGRAIRVKRTWAPSDLQDSQPTVTVEYQFSGWLRDQREKFGDSRQFDSALPVGEEASFGAGSGGGVLVALYRGPVRYQTGALDVRFTDVARRSDNDLELVELGDDTTATTFTFQRTAGLNGDKVLIYSSANPYGPVGYFPSGAWRVQTDQKTVGGKEVLYHVVCLNFFALRIGKQAKLDLRPAYSKFILTDLSLPDVDTAVTPPSPSIAICAQRSITVLGQVDASAEGHKAGPGGFDGVDESPPEDAPEIAPKYAPENAPGYGSKNAGGFSDPTTKVATRGSSYGVTTALIGGSGSGYGAGGGALVFCARWMFRVQGANITVQGSREPSGGSDRDGSGGRIWIASPWINLTEDAEKLYMADFSTIPAHSNASWPLGGLSARSWFRAGAPLPPSYAASGALVFAGLGWAKGSLPRFTMTVRYDSKQSAYHIIRYTSFHFAALPSAGYLFKDVGNFAENSAGTWAERGGLLTFFNPYSPYLNVYLYWPIVPTELGKYLPPVGNDRWRAGDERSWDESVWVTDGRVESSLTRLFDEGYGP